MGGDITYVDDSPYHINHGSLGINGNVILFNYSKTISGCRKWPWNHSGFSIDMWIKPISYGSNSMVLSISDSRSSARFWVNWDGENWGTWNCTLDNVDMKGLPTNQWSRLTLCSDAPHKKLYGFVNGKLQITLTGGDWREPRFYIGGNDPWNGGGYTQLYLNEIYVTPEVRFTEEFNPYGQWLTEYHMLYLNRHAYGILPKEEK